MIVNKEVLPNQFKANLLGCPCYLVDESSVRLLLSGLVSEKISGYSAAINAEKLYKYSNDISLRKLLNAASLPYADGVGAVLAGRILFGIWRPKINMPKVVLEEAHKKNWRVFVYGAQPDVHEVAMKRIVARYPGIVVVGSSDGFQSREETIVRIKELRPQVVLAALGSPRQEYFAANLVQQIPNGLFVVGCGGALDIVAGRLKRAPDFMVEYGLEWLYRLAQEPWRWRRQLVLPQFLFKLLKLKITAKHKDSPRNSITRK